MELELEGGSFEVQGNVEVLLPNYMAMLPPDELDEARRAAHRSELVIAAGRKPDTSEIIVMTGDNRLLVLDGDAHGVPKGRVFPIDCGQTVAVDSDEFVKGYFEMATDWVLDVATPIDVALLA